MSADGVALGQRSAFSVGAPTSSVLVDHPRPALVVAGGAVVALLAGALAMERPLMALALVAGVALVVAVALRPLLGAVALAAVVPAVSGFAPGVPLRNFRVSELLIGAVAVTLMVTSRRLERIGYDPLDWLLLAYGVAWASFGILGATRAGGHLSGSSWGTIFGQFQFFLLYRGIRSGARTTSERKLVLSAVIVAATVVSVIAIAQEVHLPAVSSLMTRLTGGVQQTGSTPSGGAILRTTGPFDNWAALAGYLLPVLVVMVALALSDPRAGRRRVAVACTALVTLAILTTVELSVLSCLVVAIIWLGFRYRQGRQVATRVLGSVGVAALALSPLVWHRIASELAPTAGITRPGLVPQTLAFRFAVWTGQYLPAIAARPFEGYGVVLPLRIAWPYPESQYISLLMEGGVGLLLVFLALSVAMIACCRRAGRSADPFDASLGRALAAVSVSLIAIDAIWPYFSNGGLPQILWALMALAAPAWQLRRAPGAAPAIAVPGRLRGMDLATGGVQ